jgi:siroheme synthase
MANADAEMLYVGKKLDHHCVPQDQINQLLVTKAQENKHVAPSLVSQSKRANSKYFR